MFCPVFNIKNFPNIVYMLITYLLYNLKSFILSKRDAHTGRVIRSIFEKIYQEMTYFYSFIYLFTYFWPCWVSAAAQLLSSCGERGHFSVVMRGVLKQLASLVAQHRLWHAQVSAAAAVGPAVAAPGL